MAKLTVSGGHSNPLTGVGETKTNRENDRDFISQFIGGSAVAQITISVTGNVAPAVRDESVIDLLPFSGATGQVDTLTSTNFEDGKIICLRNQTSGNTITISGATSGVDRIEIAGTPAGSFAMGFEDWIYVICDKVTTPGTPFWKEHDRRSIGGTSPAVHAHVVGTQPTALPDAILLEFTLPNSDIYISNSLEVWIDHIPIFKDGTEDQKFSETGSNDKFTFDIAPELLELIRISYQTGL